nr:hypothetical protein [uncultured Schaedlerella sp.]
MARKKKYPKLPNGYGSIKKLSGKRRNPYGVYSPSTELIVPGQYAPVKAICYVDDYYEGLRCPDCLACRNLLSGIRTDPERL